MFINGKDWYDSDDCQCCNGEFLIICQDPEHKGSYPELRALLRPVTMKQSGHWMMGRTKIGGCDIVLSGAYGSDGLPIHLPHKDIAQDMVGKIWDALHPIPQDLQTAFWEGGGHNTCGSEASMLRAWTVKNAEILKRG